MEYAVKVDQTKVHYLNVHMFVCSHGVCTWTHSITPFVVTLSVFVKGREQAKRMWENQTTSSSTGCLSWK